MNVNVNMKEQMLLILGYGLWYMDEKMKKWRKCVSGRVDSIRPRSPLRVGLVYKDSKISITSKCEYEMQSKMLC